MKRVLVGDNAYLFMKKLEAKNWDCSEFSKEISGGLIDSSTPDRIVYSAFSLCNNETFVEDFDNFVEAAKYASGIIATTIDGTTI